MRGKPAYGRKREVGGGLIPACAGKTIRRMRGIRGSGAHPRVCGENERCLLMELTSLGLIPACAGKTRRL